MRRDTCTTCGGAFKTDRDGLWLGDTREHRCESTCVKHLKERLAAADAARGIAEQQLTVICDGVNRRCGADNNQLPLVSLDRLLAAHARDRINLVAWVLRNMGEFGCFSGDCPHDLNSECIESIVKQYEEDEAAKGGRDGAE